MEDCGVFRPVGEVRFVFIAARRGVLEPANCL